MPGYALSAFMFLCWQHPNMLHSGREYSGINNREHAINTLLAEQREWHIAYAQSG